MKTQKCLTEVLPAGVPGARTRSSGTELESIFEYPESMVPLASRPGGIIFWEQMVSQNAPLLPLKIAILSEQVKLF